jgi:L-alanine-DL-glutamate epimerase-like enolase superfamily enzyme
MELTARCETWELARPFATSGGRIDHLTVLVVEVSDGDLIGRGEAVPSGAQLMPLAQGRSVADASLKILESLSLPLHSSVTPAEISVLLPAGPARNALDCALWDLEAKRWKRPVANLAGVRTPDEMTTAYTLSLASCEEMADDAASHRDYPVLKVKLGRGDDVGLIEAVRSAAPECVLIVDINGAWSFTTLVETAPRLRELGVALIEQPLPPEADLILTGYDCPVPLCADESCRTRADLQEVSKRYQYINIKLDKTGGLSEALALTREAQSMGLGTMVGCMAGTSLSMAPAALIGSNCEFVDLDGPLLLGRDREPGFIYRGGRFNPYCPQLWGGPTAVNYDTDQP